VNCYSHGRTEWKAQFLSDNGAPSGQNTAAVPAATAGTLDRPRRLQLENEISATGTLYGLGGLDRCFGHRYLRVGRPLGVEVDGMGTGYFNSWVYLVA
jgi:hypothetical protein